MPPAPSWRARATTRPTARARCVAPSSAASRTRWPSGSWPGSSGRLHGAHRRGRRADHLHRGELPAEHAGRPASRGRARQPWRGAAGAHRRRLPTISEGTLHVACRRCAFGRICLGGRAGGRGVPGRQPGVRQRPQRRHAGPRSRPRSASRPRHATGSADAAGMSSTAGSAGQRSATGTPTWRWADDGRLQPLHRARRSSAHCDDGACTVWFAVTDEASIPGFLADTGIVQYRTDHVPPGTNAAVGVIQRGPFGQGVSVPGGAAPLSDPRATCRSALPRGRPASLGSPRDDLLQRSPAATDRRPALALFAGGLLSGAALVSWG